MEENKTAEDPKTTSYYLTKTIENKWCVAYWDGNKFWYDPNQDGKVTFGIKREWIKEFYLLPDGKNQELTQQQEINADLKKQNAELVEALKGSTEIIENLIASKRIVNLDEAIAYYSKLIQNTPPKN